MGMFENRSSDYLSRDDLFTSIKAVRDWTRKNLDENNRDVEARITLSIGRELEKQFGERLEEIEERLAERMDAIVRECREQVSTLRHIYEDSIKQMMELVKSLPIPKVDVTVPENAIVVRNEPSNVNLTLPEQPVPHVTVNVESAPPPDVIVKVPEQKAPEVTVNVPQQKAPEVKVEIPQPRLVQKTITYDEYGRPETITEEEK